MRRASSISSVRNSQKSALWCFCVVNLVASWLLRICTRQTLDLRVVRTCEWRERGRERETDRKAKWGRGWGGWLTRTDIHTNMIANSFSLSLLSLSRHTHKHDIHTNMTYTQTGLPILSCSWSFSSSISLSLPLLLCRSVALWLSRSPALLLSRSFLLPQTAVSCTRSLSLTHALSARPHAHTHANSHTAENGICVTHTHKWVYVICVCPSLFRFRPRSHSTLTVSLFRSLSYTRTHRREWTEFQRVREPALGPMGTQPI